tara:strand:- start:164 stop:646 length:483 start_codon:yes stop_codon:yes gene_type:complete
MQTVAIAMSAMSAMAQMSAGERAKEAYEERAKNEKLRSRVEAVNARKRGVQVLKETNRNLASIVAGSPKQGLALRSGTVQDRGVFLVQRPASEDFSTTAFNASMSLLTGQMRADDLSRAGDQARLQGQLGALSTMSMAFATAGSIGGKDGIAPTLKKWIS